MDRNSLLPKYSINLEGLRCEEHPIEGQFPYIPKTTSLFNSNLIRASQFGNFNFIVGGKALYIADLLRGKGRTFLPKEPNEVHRIWTYFALSKEHGFFIYSTVSWDTKIAFASIDYANQLYEVVDPQAVAFNLIGCHAYVPEERRILIANYGRGGPKLHVFGLNPSLSKIESHIMISMPKYACLFNSIDKQIICTHVLTNRIGGGGVWANFSILHEDGSLVEIKDTNVYVKSATERKNSICGFPIDNAVEGGWSGRRAFVANVAVQMKLVERFHLPISSSSTLLEFSLDTRRWSTIYLRLPLDRLYYQLNVNEEGAMTIITYSQVDDESEDTLQLRAALIQIPLKTPEKLTKMCWFKMRGQGVSGNFEQFLFE